LHGLRAKKIKVAAGGARDEDLKCKADGAGSERFAARAA
jgi:hypothetical protein